MVAAFSDVAAGVAWGCNGTDLPNVINVPYNGGVPTGDGAEIEDGVTNTNGILTDCSTAPAALAVRTFGPDWFLPSAKELNHMYINKTTLEAVSGFTAFSGFYWSSSENSGNKAWRENFTYVSWNAMAKSTTIAVRAVRAF